MGLEDRRRIQISTDKPVAIPTLPDISPELYIRGRPSYEVRGSRTLLIQPAFVEYASSEANLPAPPELLFVPIKKMPIVVAVTPTLEDNMFALPISDKKQALLHWHPDKGFFAENEEDYPTRVTYAIDPYVGRAPAMRLYERRKSMSAKSGVCTATYVNPEEELIILQDREIHLPTLQQTARSFVK